MVSIPSKKALRKYISLISPVFLVLICLAVIFQTINLNKCFKQTSSLIGKAMAKTDKENDKNDTSPFDLADDCENECEEDSTEEDDKKNNEHAYDLSIFLHQECLVFFHNHHRTLGSCRDISLPPPERC